MSEVRIFVVRHNRRFEGFMVVAILAVIGLVVNQALAKSQLWLALLATTIPIGIGLASLLRAFYSRPAVLTVDGHGLALTAGSGQDRQEPWRLPWSAIRAVQLIQSPLGDRLVFLANSSRHDVIVRQTIPEWKLERQEEFLSILADRGLSPVSSPEAEGSEAQSFEMAQITIFSTPMVAFLVFGLVLVTILNAIQRKWVVLVVNAGVSLFMAQNFLSPARSRTRLDLSEDAITLRLLMPEGVLGALRVRPRMKEEVLWTLAWSELRRVRLGRQEDFGPGLWLELETDHTTVRTLYSKEDPPPDRSALRAQFSSRSFPVELV